MSNRGLTTRGRCLIAGGIAAMVCALLLDERDLLRIGILAAALPVITIIITARRQPGLQITRTISPDRIAPGTTGQVTLTATATRRTGRLELRESSVDGFSPGAHWFLPPMGPGSRAHVRYMFTAQRRGRFTIPKATAKITDLFGLWEQRHAIDEHTPVLVIPEVRTLTGVPPATGSQSSASGPRSPGGSGGELGTQVRPYVPGDDLRTVHWRMSARRDDLVVRQREPAIHAAVTLMLDHREAAHVGEGAQSSLEMAVSFTASVGVHLTHRDYHLTAVTHSGQIIASGNDIADDLLTGLADLTSTDETIDTQVLAGPSTVIAVFGTLTEPAARALAAAPVRRAKRIAVLIDTDTWVIDAPTAPAAASPHSAGAPNQSTATAAVILGHAGWDVVTIAQNETISTAWSAICTRQNRSARQVIG